MCGTPETTAPIPFTDVAWAIDMGLFDDFQPFSHLSRAGLAVALVDLFQFLK
jgi:hypothetical protein